MKFEVCRSFTPVELKTSKELLLQLLGAKDFCVPDQTRMNIPHVGIYLDGHARIAQPGYWEVMPGHVNLFYGKTAGRVVNISTKVAVLSCLSVAFTLDEDPEIRDALTAAFERCIKDGRVEAHTLILSRIMPSKMAFSPDFTQFAACLEEKFFTPQGVEIKVPNTWTIMDC